MSAASADRIRLRDRWAALRSRAASFGYDITVRTVRGQTAPTLVKLIDQNSGETAAFRIGPAVRLDMMLDQIERELAHSTWTDAAVRMYGDAANVTVQ